MSMDGLILAIAAPDTNSTGIDNTGTLYIFTRDSLLDDFVEIDHFDGACENEQLGSEGVIIDV
eukprot:CAMPEP_0194435340 /NCGR_PEP_ID=MMETSP0176-20130528/88202_1 /TAXON_ID=216777 /ORGANISM="Proboscia alata, Strain PI-D3" /LENGTH=62 /DNA_ID=CAMNT_0039254557 /DNA_START=111 /DNA_END=295 /DNA_ORIENTATION=-